MEIKITGVKYFFGGGGGQVRKLEEIVLKNAK